MDLLGLGLAVVRSAEVANLGGGRAFGEGPLYGKGEGSKCPRMPDPHGASDEGLVAELPGLCSAAYFTPIFLLEPKNSQSQQVFLSCL